MPLLWVIAALAAALAATLAVILYFELRNQHHIWHDACITPLETRNDIVAVLEAIGEVVEGRGIRWWLDYGTLLGAWRLGGVMTFDHDLDLSFLDEDEDKLRAAIPALEARGITPLSAEHEYICTVPTELPEAQATEVLTVIDKLEQDEDVQKVFHTLA